MKPTTYQQLKPRAVSFSAASAYSGLSETYLRQAVQRRALPCVRAGRSTRLLVEDLDRFLMSIGLPQTYGTQFEHSDDGDRYQLRLPIDDASVLHFEKRFFGVPPVMERLAQLNRRIQN